MVHMSEVKKKKKSTTHKKYLHTKSTFTPKLRNFDDACMQNIEYIYFQ